jgi:hypothetical protein
MCRNSFLSMILFFACGFFWLSSMAFQSNSIPSSNEDVFALTATSIVATATAVADPNCRVSIGYYIFNYSYENGADWEGNPAIQDYQAMETCAYALPFWSHSISISSLDFPRNESIALVIEDLISRLPDYPPKNENILILVNINFANFGPLPFGRFSYQQAIAAYESGLRGQALLEALAFPSVESVILSQLPYIQMVQTMTYRSTANPESMSFELTLTSVVGTATASTTTPDPFPLTVTSLIATATAYAQVATQSP